MLANNELNEMVKWFSIYWQKLDHSSRVYGMEMGRYLKILPAIARWFAYCRLIFYATIIPGPNFSTLINHFVSFWHFELFPFFFFSFMLRRAYCFCRIHFLRREIFSRCVGFYAMCVCVCSKALKCRTEIDCSKWARDAYRTLSNLANWHRSNSIK